MQFWLRVSRRKILRNNFEFVPVNQEMSLKDISYLELRWPFVHRSGTIFAILVEGIMRNNSVNSFQIWASSSGGSGILKISYLELWRPYISVLLDLNLNVPSTIFQLNGRVFLG